MINSLIKSANEPLLSEVSKLEIKLLEDFLVRSFSENIDGFGNVDKLRDAAKTDITDKRHTFFIMRENAKIIATGAVCKQPFNVSTYGLSWLAVDPEYRHKGYGQKMVQYRINHLLETVEAPFTVMTTVSEAGFSAYEKIGFAGSTKDHNGRLIIAKTVRPA